ncbi:hypothetical protein IFO68_21200 [Photobacterium sp. CAU 1568]|uniref:Uncharacterized protein n=1 Tax=Photobacterium arenosum TaxID=2774143 RepID=A0ABR9BRJ6_9GAMM|nr:hypothetical protein [Photobacterium arenosum]MBD8515200.1 hypothetical protein [Photobacterium arenosum]
MYTRTVQSIMSRTKKVDAFYLPGFAREVEVRSLNMRKHNSRYIVVLNDFHDKKAWEEILVVTEVSLKHNKLRYVTSPASQHPEFAALESYIKQKIDSIVEQDQQYLQAMTA